MVDLQRQGKLDKVEGKTHFTHYVVRATLRVPAAGDEPGCLEHLQVLHDRTAIDFRETGAKLGCGLRVIFQGIEDGASHRGGDCFEDEVFTGFDDHA